MKKANKIKLLFLVMFTSASLSACVPEDNVLDFEDLIENGGAYEVELKENKEEGEDSTNPQIISDGGPSVTQVAKDDNLKVLSTYKIEAETVNFESFLKDVLDKTHSLQGYISKKNVEKISNTNKNKAEISIKVPRENLPEIISFLEKELSIRSESFSTVDVTEKYYSIDDKIASLESKEKRLLELYEKTTDISKVIEIDDKLTEVVEQKEEELRKKSKIDGGVVLSRIDIDLKEVKKYSNKEDNKEPLLQRLSKGLNETFNSFLGVGVEILLFIIKSIPFIIGGGLFVFIFNKYLKKFFMENKDLTENDKINETPSHETKGKSEKTQDNLK